MALPTAEEITNFFLYGSKTKPDDLTNPEIIRPLNLAPVTFPDIPLISVQEFMNPETGPGRFAAASRFELVQKFFEPGFFTPDIPVRAEPYTKAEIAAFLGLDDYGLTIQQMDFKDNYNDLAERTYIYNTTAFQISDDTKFYVTATGRRIESLSIEPRRERYQENFDFTGGGFLTNLGNLILRPLIDPSKIGRTVNLDFTDGASPKTNMDLNGYKKNQALVNSWEGVSSAELINEINSLALKLFNEGATKFLDSQNRPVLYGSEEDNILSAATINSLKFYQPYSVNGNVLIAGGGNDKLFTFEGNDLLNGGTGADTLYGGKGFDTYVLSQKGDGADIVIDEDGKGVIQVSAGGKIAFELKGDAVFERNDSSSGDKIYRMAETGAEVRLNEATKELKINAWQSADEEDGVTIQDFDSGDLGINLKSQKEDIAFVIDTTGSMADDIGQVKAQAAFILSRAFAGEGSDTRVAVVGFNDPGANVFTSFTDQDEIADRKAAASVALGGITVNGGGDIPEAVNLGLKLALDGSAGEWRTGEDVSRRIILFGDAGAKDKDLEAQVLALAGNVNATIIAGPPQRMIAPGISMTSFNLLEKNAAGEEIIAPVQIFTVQIGSDPEAQADFETYSAATGGRSFQADNAFEAVEQLIKALATPTARGEEFTVAETKTVTGNVLLNDFDPDDDKLSVVSVTGVNGEVTTGENTFLASGALVRMNEDGSFVYNPNGAFNDLSVGKTGSDSFIYTIEDTEGNINSGLVKLTVQGEGKTFYGTAKNDRFTGTKSGDAYLLYAGNDTVCGGGGIDTMRGGAGADRLFGEFGNDYLYGDAGNDSLYGGSGADILIGGLGNDKIFGDSGKDTLSGKEGDDNLYGGTGNDTLAGGSGHDKLFGQENDDELFGQEGKDLLYGDVGSDYLDGGLENDTLYGNAGDDILYGDLGADRLYGHSGADIFLYGDLNDSVKTAYDTIQGFESGIDTLDLASLGLSASAVSIKSLGSGRYDVTFGAESLIKINTAGRTLTMQDIAV